MQDQNQYQQELLEWCNNIYFHLERMKPEFSKLNDINSLENLEKSYRELKENLQTDLIAEDDLYQAAVSLYDQWEKLNAYHEENKSERCTEIEEQKQYLEELMEWRNTIFIQLENLKPNFSKLIEINSLEEWAELRREFKQKLNTDLNIDFDDYQTVRNLYVQLQQQKASSYQEELDSERYAEKEEQKQDREVLLEWCNSIYFHWERMKPSFSKRFDLKSLEEWEELYRDLTTKLQTNLIVDDDDYRIAKSLYEQFEQLFNETHTYPETDVESEVVISI